MSTGRARLAAAGILALSVVLSALASRDLSAPSDEFVRIASGLSALRLHDYRMDHATPPLAKYLVAAPLLFMRVNLALDDPTWAHVDDQAWTAVVVYRAGNDPLRMLRYARPPMWILLALLGALVFAWTRRLYGPGPAVLSTAIFALTPNTLAYTFFANMDFALGLAFSAALYVLWRFLEAPSRGRLALCGVALGLALATHFASIALLLIYPCLLLAGAIHWSSFRKAQPRPGTPLVRGVYTGLGHRTLLFLTLCFFAMLAIALLVVWAVYGFEVQPLLRHAPGLADKRAWIASHVPGPPSLRAAVARIASDAPVPLATFTRGILNIFRRTGEKGTQGYWWFYLVVLATKTPLPVLILLAWAFLRRPRRPSYHEWFLLLPAGVFLLLASRSAYQSGLRNVYPLIPLLAIYAGRVLCTRFPHVEGAPVPGTRSRIAAAALGGWLALTTLHVHPHYLSYYNTLVGGPDGGIRAAVGAVDLDWGQGLVGLKRLMDVRGISEVFLASPGTVDPSIYAIRCRRLWSSDLADPSKLSPGVYAISTTYVRRLDWLKARKPFARVGNVLWLYRIGKTGPEARRKPRPSGRGRVPYRTP